MCINCPSGALKLIWSWVDVVYNPVDISQTEKWTVANTLLPLRNVTLAKVQMGTSACPSIVGQRQKSYANMTSTTIIIGSFSHGSYLCIRVYTTISSSSAH